MVVALLQQPERKIMQTGNEYIQAVIKYLSQNSEMQAHLKILESDKTAKQAILSTIKYPHAKYTETGCFGTDIRSKVEQEMERRDKLRNELADINLSSIEIKTNLDKMTNALNQLDDISRVIIKGRYIEHDTWEHISHQVHYGIKACRRKHDKALQSMAISMFGLEAAS